MSFRAACSTLIVFALFPSLARADDWGSLAGSIALASDYRFRGVSQSDLGPVPQAEFDWNAPDDWTASIWGSRVDWRDHQHTSIELDPSIDKHFTLGDTGLDVQAIYHAFPDHDPPRGGIRYSAFEAIATASHSWDALTLTGTIAWSPDNVAETGNSWDVGGSGAYVLSDWLTASGDIGVQWMRRWDGQHLGYPYTYWDAGITAKYDNYSLDLRYVGTNLSGEDCALTFGGTHWCQAGVVAVLSYAVLP